ncbi:MAG TPA: polyprenyl synthetase family protein [Gemmatimonadaceae bacterium]|nr:polyprenyl synthetase family protein [Gemmatimonadaceae bacterium]
MISREAVDWSADRAAIDHALADLCDTFAPRLAEPIASAVRYALLGSGKRLRGLLVLAAYRAAGGDGDATGLAAAVEVVHSYSLVHDDLPCMDDDDVRRGRPTTHRAFGVRTATVAGVSMVPLAAAAALDACLGLGLSPETGGRVVGELMRASGAGGMVGGQLLDLEGEGRPLGIAELEHIHRGKTGALIRAAAVVGGIAARASESRLAALATFGATIGLAFQIADDVLDVTATTDRLGKTAGRDRDLQKSTYPVLLGVEAAAERARSLVAEGRGALESAGLLSPELEALATFAVEREW